MGPKLRELVATIGGSPEWIVNQATQDPLKHGLMVNGRMSAKQITNYEIHFSRMYSGETSSHRRLAIAVRHSFGQLQWSLEWRGDSGAEEDPREDNSEASKIICLPKRPDDIDSDNVTIIVRYRNMRAMK